jgi:uncharacterized protein
MQFTWSSIKAVVNRAKHGVEFEEAQTCLCDPQHIVFYDPDHSDDEDRELLIGHSSLGRLLIISYTLRGSVIRVISARKPTRTEARTYAQGI